MAIDGRILRRRADFRLLATFIIVLPSYAQNDSRAPPNSLVAATPTFAFHSDLSTNVHDALVTVGQASSRGEPTLFQAGPERRCFSELTAAERSAWNSAVRYYAEIIAPTSQFDREQMLIRTDLALLREGWSTSAEDQRFIDIARGMRAAAAPAYEACHWPAQNATNRRWIDDIVRLLATHEKTLVARLEQLYQRPWDGLPIRIDVVEMAGGNANSIVTAPTGGHILVSSVNDGIQDRHALEMVFHEASHLLTATWRSDPLPAALAGAAQRLDVALPADLWHVVLFYVTGETVRTTLLDAGEPGYTPYLYAEGLFERGGGGAWGGYRRAIEDAWPRYLRGERTLSDAAMDTLRALRD